MNWFGMTPDANASAAIAKAKAAIVKAEGIRARTPDDRPAVTLLRADEVIE